MRHRLTHILHSLHPLQNNRQVRHARISRIRLPAKEIRRPPAPAVHPKPPAAVSVRAHRRVDRQRDGARPRVPGAVKVLLRPGHVVVEQQLLEGDLPGPAVRVQGLLVGGRGVEVEQPGVVGAAEEAELAVWVGELRAAAGGDVEGGGEVVAQDGGWEGRGGICYAADAVRGENEERVSETPARGIDYDPRRSLCVTHIRGLILTRPYDSRLFRYENSPAAPAV